MSKLSATHKIDAGFAFPSNYRVEDHDATFRIAVAVLIASVSIAAILGTQIVGQL